MSYRYCDRYIGVLTPSASLTEAILAELEQEAEVRGYNCLEISPQDLMTGPKSCDFADIVYLCPLPAEGISPEEAYAYIRLFNEIGGLVFGCVSLGEDPEEWLEESPYREAKEEFNSSFDISPISPEDVSRLGWTQVLREGAKQAIDIISEGEDEDEDFERQGPH